MKTLKKISASEFRLHSKNFPIDYSPLNYFEKFRLNILFSRLLFWFFRKYGLYLYCSKLRLLSNRMIFQFYYYRTFYHLRHRRLWTTRKIIWSTTPIRVSRGGKKKKIKLRRFLNQNLFKTWIFSFFSGKNINRLKAHKCFRNLKLLQKKRFAFIQKQNLYQLFWQRKQHIRNLVRASVSRIKFFSIGPYIFFFQGWQKRQYFFHLFNKHMKLVNNTKKTLKRIYFNFFFLYFFWHFFKQRAVILYKSMYKFLLSNKSFVFEHKILMRRLKYLKQYDWSFDFLFLFHYAINLGNFDFIFPFFLYQIKISYKQRPFLTIIFIILRTLYYLKTHIRGIRVIVHGPYDRHGRSRTLLFRIGDLAYTSYSSFILYDLIQWPTFYGATHLKMWIEYTVPPFSK